MKSFLPALVVVLAVAFLVVTMILPIAQPSVSASPKASADTLKQLEGEFMKAAADKAPRVKCRTMHPIQSNSQMALR